MGLVEVEIEGDIAFVTIDNPPVNALSAPLRKALFDAIRDIETNIDVRGALLLCKGKTFVAGADIREFGGPIAKPQLVDLIELLESSKKIWAAAMHGTILGGGLELALGCSYRIAMADTQFGLPEVALGIIPGAGGTQRTPRLTGVEAALDLLTTGKPIHAGKAVQIGLIDQIVEGDLRGRGVAFLSEKKTTRLLDTNPVQVVDKEALQQKLVSARKAARGQISVIAAAHAVMLSSVLPLKEGLSEERKIFEELRGSDQSRALRYQFFAEREVAKIPELENVVPLPFHKIGVVGAGTMGCGIAASCILAGLDVALVEKDEAARSRGQARLQEIFVEAVKRGQMKQERFDALPSELIMGDVSILADRDFVIEAVFEDLDIKKTVLAQIGSMVSPGALIATNTSYLDLNQLAEASGRPENFLGLHFFAPAHVMKLLEIVRGAKTSSQTLATGFALAKVLKKTAVLSGNAEGFIGNRIWQAYRREIEYMLEDGATPYEIDNAMEAYGFPMGPFKVADLSGLDIAWAQRKRRSATRSQSGRYIEIPDMLCEAGRLGRKANAGWYDYVEGKPQRSETVLKMIEGERMRKNITPQKFTAEDIQKTVLAVIVAEGKKLLEEKIALRELDVDVVMVAGYGYPRWRGGPMFEAGLTSVK